MRNRAGHRRLGREVVLGPVRLETGVLVMRSPRLRDAAAWSSARRANREFLERVSPAWGDDWMAEQSPATWVERWWHLRPRYRRAARSFVILLDGRFIGEFGADALDEETYLGEGSVWMVRDHGSALVAHTSFLLLLERLFAGPDPLDRFLSPIATATRSRRNGLARRVGSDIEAIVERDVGGVAVEHDWWVVHNTPEQRAEHQVQLREVGRSAGPTAGAPLTAPLAAQTASGRSDVLVALLAVGRVLARSLVRAVRGRVRALRGGRRRSETSAAFRSPDASVTVDGTGAVRRDGRVLGRVLARPDRGTRTLLLRPRAERPDDRDELADVATAALLAADGIVAREPYIRWVDVLLTPPVQSLGESLGDAGFTHIATLRPNPSGPHRYPGEHWWRRPVAD